MTSCDPVSANGLGISPGFTRFINKKGQGRDHNTLRTQYLENI